jgi:flagellar protein FlaJ
MAKVDTTGQKPPTPTTLASKIGKIIKAEESPISFIYRDERAFLKKRKKKTLEIKKTRKLTGAVFIIVIASVISCIILLTLYVLSAKQPNGSFNLIKANQDYFVGALLVLLGPYAFYAGEVVRRLNKMEDKFPDFLKDMAEYWRGGLSMTAAIETISRGEYGALNKEVEKMANQISWGVAFEDVLKMFAERVKTSIIVRSVSLVIEANKAGGKIADILLTAANDAREIRWLKDDRRRKLAMYTMVSYISYVVYLAVIVIICLTFLPAINTSGAGTSGTASSTVTGGGGVGAMMQQLDINEINFIFFFSTIIQAIGNGMMAGAMSEGTAPAGMKHAFIMSVICWAVFRGAGLI